MPIYSQTLGHMFITTDKIAVVVSVKERDELLAGQRVTLTDWQGEPYAEAWIDEAGQFHYSGASVPLRVSLGSWESPEDVT